MPKAMSNSIAPVGMASTKSREGISVNFMIAPLPCFFSIWAMVASNNFHRSSFLLGATIFSSRSSSVSVFSGTASLRAIFLHLPFRSSQILTA